MLDGILVSNIVYELQEIIGGRIDKIHQPNSYELVLSIRAKNKNKKLLLSSNANEPRINFVNEKSINPTTPPSFCMVLRKHLNGRIISVRQPNFDRIVEIEVEATNELFDKTNKKLIIEIMGRHSNIILIDDNGIVIDSIKHVNKTVSSVRQILPKRPYKSPPSNDKLSFLDMNIENLKSSLASKKNQPLQSVIFKSYTGISPHIANLICTNANLDPDDQFLFNEDNLNSLFRSLSELKTIIENNEFNPYIAYSEDIITSIHSVYPFSNNELKLVYYNTVSEAIETYYAKYGKGNKIKQKREELKRLVKLNISRCQKKSTMFFEELDRVSENTQCGYYGELILINLYRIEKGSSSFTTRNLKHPEEEDVTIPLNPNINASKNAENYFKLYRKMRRQHDALNKQIIANYQEQYYLESILESLELNISEGEINEIMIELEEEKIIKQKEKNKPKDTTYIPQPLSFTSSEGNIILVGKNNKQNEAITSQAKGTDIWLHTKDLPGSHVIIKNPKREEISDTLLEEGAALAAFYSKGKKESLVAVDYTLRKFVKKPSGAKAGMVIYTNHKTIYVKPSNIINCKTS